MSGIEFDASSHRITIKNGSRLVATTDGTLVMLLPTQLSLTGQTAEFPDFNKDNLYVHTWGVDYATETGDYYKGESCATYITVTPQNFSAKTALADAPAGADFFMGLVRINRTTSPAYTWVGNTIGVLPIANQWMPWNGSCLMEMAENMSRALHIYIDDVSGSATYRKLVMEVQQSVGPAAGGYDDAIPTGGSPTLDYSGGGLVNGGNTASGARNGFPVIARTSKSRGWLGPFSLATNFSDYKWSGSSPCARNDNTDYRSVYSVDLKGYFGRRS